MTTVATTSITRAALALALLGSAVGMADAQTIRPLVAEHRSEGRGRVELVNQGDDPLTVVLDVQGFSVDEAGQVHDVPLTTQHVKLSASSLRVPPRQTRYVFYEASADVLPNWFVILARFSGYPRKQFSGVDVQLELPHFVYLLPSAGWREGDIIVRPASLDASTGTLSVIVENVGDQFGRIEGLDVRGAGQHASNGGFPLFPRSQRRIELHWPGEQKPDAVAVRARGFSFERPLVVTPP